MIPGPKILFTYYRRVYIRHDGKLIRSILIPFTEKVTKPLC